MVFLVDHTSYGFTKKSLTALRRDTLALLEQLVIKYRRPYGKINIAFLSEEGIRDLHNRFLHKDCPTDILTFPDSEVPQSGDIALCPYRILLYAFQDCREPIPWFYHTLLHGLLHLYGIEHDYEVKSLQRVYGLQKRILKKTKLHEENIYEVFEKIIHLIPSP